MKFFKILFILFIVVRVSYGDELDIAKEFETKALMAYQDNKYIDTLRYFKESLMIYEKVLGRVHKTTALSYYSVAHTYYLMRDYYNALKYHKEAMIIREKIFGKEHKTTIISYGNITSIYEKIGDYSNALKYNKKIIFIYEKEFGKEDIKTTKEYSRIALLYARMHNYPKALKYGKKSLLSYEQIFGKEHISIALKYNIIASFYKSMGDYSNSLKYAKKSLLIYEKNKKYMDTALTCNMIALAYKEMGDYSKALNYIKKAIKIQEKVLGKEHIETAISYNNIALIYRGMKDYSKALEYTKKTIIIREKISKKNIETAISYDNIALIYQNLGDFYKALNYNKKAMVIYENILGKEHIDMATNYNNIAIIYENIKDYSKALNYSKKAMYIYENLLGKGHIKTARSYNNIALMYQMMGEYSKSFQYIDKSFNIYFKNKIQNSIILDIKQKEDYKNLNDNMSELLVYSASYLYHLSKENNITKTKEVNKKIINHLLNYKGSISEGSNLINMLEEKSDKSTKKDIKKLRELTITLSNLYNDIQKDNTKKIKHIKEKISKVEIKLNRVSEEFREFNNLKNISYTDISQTLKEDELYIDFIKTKEHYYIFTLDKSNNINFEMILQGRLLEYIIKEFRINNKTKASKSLANTQKNLNIIYNILDKYINFKSKKSLIISPDGLLNFLPFEALYDGDKYLVESVNISYIPSGRELVRQSRRENNITAKDIVVFTHPDYNLIDKKDNPQDYNITTKSLMRYLYPLEGSLEEAKSIKTLYPKAKIYQDKDATVENLFKIKSPKILHISTHGGFLDDKTITNPMQQSFLAFVDANLVTRDLDYRGVATALKLSSLELSNTQLVFLSACETGLGKINQAEGVQGLPKAFIQAGAKNVIMSLWQVDDKATTTLTKYFYESVKSGKDYKDALQEAKIKMIDMHPYYWSAFILSGV